jgi:two-component system sensor histidine kinase BarA
MKRILRVLVVDDDDIIRRVFCEFLSKMGIEVESAGNGVEALGTFVEKSFDVVLTDVQMPCMDGLTLAREIKGKKPKTLIIVMSGHVHVGGQTNCYADHFLTKPFGLKEMYHLINRAVESETQTHHCNAISPPKQDGITAKTKFQFDDHL